MKKVITVFIALVVVVVAIILALILRGKELQTTKIIERIATPSATLAPKNTGNSQFTPTQTPTSSGGTTTNNSTIINNPPPQPTPAQPTQAQPTPTPFLNIPLPTIKIGGITL